MSFYKSIPLFNVLSDAARHGHIIIFQENLSIGGILPLCDLLYVLQIAAEYDHFDIVKYIISLIQIQSDHDDKFLLSISRCINLSSANGNLSMVEYLISLGDELGTDYQKNIIIGITLYRYPAKECYRSAFSHCVSNGHLNIIKYFVSLGVDIKNDQSRLDIHAIEAYKRGYTDIVDYFISLGATLQV